MAKRKHPHIGCNHDHSFTYVDVVTLVVEPTLLPSATMQAIVDDSEWCAPLSDLIDRLLESRNLLPQE
jgi:hypothetical protein